MLYYPSHAITPFIFGWRAQQEHSPSSHVPHKGVQPSLPSLSAAVVIFILVVGVVAVVKNAERDASTERLGAALLYDRRGFRVLRGGEQRSEKWRKLDYAIGFV